MNRVFISYSRKNEAFAERLARDLGDAGLDVWIDLRQIQAGELWQQEIFRGLERADFVIFCLSPAAIQSEWVQRELETTRAAGKRVYPVMVEETLAELQNHPTLSWLTDVQFIRFEGRYELAFKELLEALPGGRRLGSYDVYDPASIPNPFKGLEAFQERDAAYFFGREDLTQRALERLAKQPFLAVVGASGSGKSSLVRAGIIPQLRRGALPGSQQSPVLIFTPGTAPLESWAMRLNPLIAQQNPEITPVQTADRLRLGQGRSLVWEALKGLPSEARLILVVDQFEEAFTRAGDVEREAFFEALLALARDPKSRTVIIVTMRADFFGALSRYPNLALLFEGDGLLIATEMTTANLVRAIEGPAQAVGLKFEPKLVDCIIEDVKNQPGSLPLLQYALKELYERRDGANLTQAAYDAIGGVQQALARHAEDIYQALSQARQEVMRRVLLRLVEVAPTGEATRRKVPFAELQFRDVNPELVEEIIDLLTAPESRLLIASRSVNTGGTEPVVWLEVSHEALIREWERFKSWVATSADDLRYESELRKAAQDWNNSGRDPAYLLTGKRLQRAEIWLEDHDLTRLQRELIQASLESRKADEQADQARLQRELALQQQSARTARFAAIGLAVFVVVLMVGGLAIVQSNATLQQQEAALRDTNEQLDEQINLSRRSEDKARSLAISASAAQALGDNDGDLSLALAVAAAESEAAPPQAERALADIAFGPGTRLRIPTESRVTALDFSTDGERVAVGLDNGHVMLLDTASGEIVQSFAGHASSVIDVAISPDGRQVLSASNDKTDNFIQWDITTGEPIRNWQAYNDQKVNAVAYAAGIEPINVTGDVTRLAVSDDGTVVVTGSRFGQVARVQGTQTLWSTLPLGIDSNRVTALAVKQDGSLILVGFNNGAMLLLDPANGQPIQRFTSLDNSVSGLAFIPRTTYFLAAGSDSSLRLWDIATGRQTDIFEIDSNITALAMSGDGHTAVTGASNNTLRFWDVLGSTQLGSAQVGFVTAAALNTSGTIAAVAGDSIERVDGSGNTGILTLLEMPSSRVLQQLQSPDNTLFQSVAFSADGALIAGGTSSGGLAIWRVGETTPFRVIAAHSKFILTIAFSPDGTQVATGSSDNRAVIWDVSTGAPIKTFVGHAAGINSVAFSADGAWFVTGSSDNSMILWDRATGEPITQFDGHSAAVRSVAINSDGTRLLSGSSDATVRLWDVAAGRELRRFTGHDRMVSGVAFTPNGEDIISVSSDGTVRVWAVQDGIEMRRIIVQSDRGRAIGFKTLSVTADGSRLLGGMLDNTVRLLRLLPDKQDLLEWARGNRFVRGLTCTERLLFGVEDPTNTVFVAGNEALPLTDASGVALDSLDAGTPLRVLRDETPEDALLHVCTPDGAEGFVDAGGITSAP